MSVIEHAQPVFLAGGQERRAHPGLTRVLDCVIALLGLVLAAPLFLLAPVLIALTSPGPVFYRQLRVGLGGRRFMMWKFRSMRVDAESDGRARWATANDPRVTPLGGLLRRSRVDELPQLFNVLRGEMSLVGPRPERPEFVELLAQRLPGYERRHLVKPGMTGWAQVRFRYGASVEDARIKLLYDLEYLSRRSVAFDCRILLRTIAVVLCGDAVARKGDSPRIPAMKRFALGFATASLLLGASAASATVIYSQGHITSEADILNVGTVVVANNTGFADVPVTINGVAFGNSNAGFYGSSTGGTIDFSNQFASGSSLDTLLSGMVFQHGSFGHLTLTLTGLTAGNEYLLQLFLANTYNTTGHASRVSIQGQAYDMNDLGLNADWIRADFIASSSTEVITFGDGTTDTDSRMVVNAYALENIASAVPEPASLVLLGSGLMGLALWRRGAQGGREA